MTTIVDGNFQQQDEAQRALSDLESAGFAADKMAIFFVNPPGQHDLYPIGGDEEESPSTRRAPSESAAGAAVGVVVGVAVGLATLPILGPGAAAAGAAVGAYTGSLHGALSGMDDKKKAETQSLEEPHPSGPPRQSGMLVAVSAPASEQQEIAIQILRRHGATHIERSEGTIVAGQWTDFSPLTPVNLVTN